MTKVKEQLTLRYSKTVKMKKKVLELFAGSRSIGKEAEKQGMKVFSVDWQNFKGIDLAIDVEKMVLNDIPFVPDLVWASPDCTTYSIAACSTHRIGNQKIGFTPISKYAEKCDRVNKHFIELIKDWLVINPDMVFFIENPRGMLRHMDFMKEFIGRVEPLRLSYLDKIEKLYRDRMFKLKANANLNRQISRVSPAYLLSNTASLFCGNDLQAYESFVESLRMYRYQLIDGLKRKNAFTSYEFFTSQFNKNGKNTEIRNTAPVFKYREVSIAHRINHTAINILLLLIQLLVTVLASLYFFTTYDPR